MSTEVWFRNPDLFIRECAELGAFNIAWDRGHLVKKRIDPDRFASLHVPSAIDYRMLLVGDQGTAELTRNHTVASPAAVYPTWDYEMDTITSLEEMLATNVAELDRYVEDKQTPPDERVVRGQEHRVVVIRVPPANYGPGRKFLRTLHEMQADYPHAIVHVHNLYGYSAAFGLGFRSVDIDPRTSAFHHKVILPNGREIAWERAASMLQWVNVLGWSAPDLETPSNRCKFNMQSAQWAGENFAELVKFKSRGDVPVDPRVPDADVKSQTTITSKSKPIVATVDDKVICDRCSLADACKFYRAGEVCAIPGTEQSQLAAAWGTRNVDTIMDGLAELMARDTDRLEMGATAEKRAHEIGLLDSLDPEVTKLSKVLFENGVKLARIVDPARFPSGARVGIGINIGPGQALDGPQGVAAALIALAREQGLPPESLSNPEVVTKLLAIGAGETDATDAEVTYD